MKPRTRNLSAVLLTGALMLAPLPHFLSAASPTPSDRKKKKGENASPTPAPSKAKGGSSIPLPLPFGKPASNVHIPDLDVTGKVLSMLLAEKATRLDEDHIKFEGMHMDFNKPDGKSDFHVTMPASIMNLKTHIIASDDPVQVSTQDFELTGEKMEFNTVEREGRLIGNVRMVIHNLKQLSGVSDQAAKKSE